MRYSFGRLPAGERDAITEAVESLTKEWPAANIAIFGSHGLRIMEDVGYGQSESILVAVKQLDMPQRALEPDDKLRELMEGYGLRIRLFSMPYLDIWSDVSSSTGSGWTRIEFGSVKVYVPSYLANKDALASLLEGHLLDTMPFGADILKDVLWHARLVGSVLGGVEARKHRSEGRELLGLVAAFSMLIQIERAERLSLKDAELMVVDLSPINALHGYLISEENVPYLIFGDRGSGKTLALMKGLRREIREKKEFLPVMLTYNQGTNQLDVVDPLKLASEEEWGERLGRLQGKPMNW